MKITYQIKLKKNNRILAEETIEFKGMNKSNYNDIQAIESRANYKEEFIEKHIEIIFNKNSIITKTKKNERHTQINRGKS